MLSVVIHTQLSYPAMPLARQLKHHWFVHSGPLVLGKDLLKYPAPTKDRDRNGRTNGVSVVAPAALLSSQVRNG